MSSGPLSPSISPDARRFPVLDAGVLCAGPDDDGPGPGAVLWRAGAEEECAGHHDAELYSHGGGYRPVGVLRLQPGVPWGQSRSSEVWATCSCTEWGRSRPGLCGHDSPADLHGVPAHVRHHHSGPDYRRVCRADEIQSHAAVHGALVASSFTTPWRTWFGAKAAC